MHAGARLGRVPLRDALVLRLKGLGQGLSVTIFEGWSRGRGSVSAARKKVLGGEENVTAPLNIFRPKKGPGLKGGRVPDGGRLNHLRHPVPQLPVHAMGEPEAPLSPSPLKIRGRHVGIVAGFRRKGRERQGGNGLRTDT